MKKGSLEFSTIIKLIIGAVVIILVVLFALYLPEVFDGIKNFFKDFNLLERFK